MNYRTSCRCLPGCFETNYDNVKSYSNLARNINVYDDINANLTSEYFVYI